MLEMQHYSTLGYYILYPFAIIIFSVPHVTLWTWARVTVLNFPASNHVKTPTNVNKQWYIFNPRATTLISCLKISLQARIHSWRAEDWQIDEQTTGKAQRVNERWAESLSESVGVYSPRPTSFDMSYNGIQAFVLTIEL